MACRLRSSTCATIRCRRTCSCFFNKKRTQVRCLFWDRTGYCVLAKRLARGQFRFTEQLESGCRVVELESVELALILEGIDVEGSASASALEAQPYDEGCVKVLFGRRRAR